jgi:hypothetical protein
VTRRMNLRVASVLAAGALATCAAPALAATQLGQVAPSGAIGAGGCTNCAEFQVATAPGSAPYVVGPGGGVITSWTFHAVNTATAAQLRLFAPGPGAGRFTLIAETPYHSFTLGETATVPTQIPVAAGMHLGVAVSAGDEDYITGVTGDHVSSNPDFNLPIGGSELVTTSDQRHANIAAIVEPDADHDGYGDETQDQCPSDPAKQTSCSVPTPPVSPSPPTQPTAVSGATVVAKHRQSIKHGALTVAITSAGSASVSATGVAGTGKLRSISHTLVAGRKTALKLKLSKSSLRAIRMRLAHHKHVSAKVTVVVHDGAGDHTTSLHIRLTR